MSEPRLPPGLPFQRQIHGAVGERDEVMGFPCVSERIEEFSRETYRSPEGSLRAFTLLKVLYQAHGNSVWICNWHSDLRPKDGTPPLIEMARFGEGTRVVALKIIDSPIGHVDFLLQSKELAVLCSLPPHRNVVALYDFFLSGSQEVPKLYLAMGAMEGNLYHLIKVRKGKVFAGGLVSTILHQTLLGLNHVHSNGYFHRDLKPENILITTQGLFEYLAIANTVASNNILTERDVVVIVKLCDFGLARGIGSEGPYTEYVNTRWYRSPEVLLYSRQYSSAVDMWALGAIAAEILNLSPLFPGTDQLDQLVKICNVLGHPANQARFDHNGMPLDGGSWPVGMELARELGFQFPEVVPRPFSSFFQLQVIPVSLLSFIKALLVYDPENRLTSHSSLRHEYILETATHRQVPDHLQRY